MNEIETVAAAAERFSLSKADILLTSPLMVLLVFALIPLTAKVINGNRPFGKGFNLTVSLVGLFLAAAIMTFFFSFNNASNNSVTTFSGMFLFDGLYYWGSLILFFITGATCISMSETPSTQGDQLPEQLFLTFCSLIGMMILLSAVNLLAIFVGLELASLPMYLLVALSHEQSKSKEAAIKYFVLGAISTALFLFGTSMVFAGSGTFSLLAIMDSAENLLAQNQIFVFGMTLVAVAYLFKAALVPFHAWAPDVYQGAATPVTLFMSSALKAAVFLSLLRFFAARTLNTQESFFMVLQWVSAITILVGSLAALIQVKLKRILAYSAIAHSGFLMIGVLAASISSHPAAAVSSVIYYLFAYGVSSLGAFAVIGSLEARDYDDLELKDLAGLHKTSPFHAFALMAFMLSLAGIPPLIGFFAKFYLFSISIKEGMLWLTLWGVLGSLLGVYYYIKPIATIFMTQRDSMSDANKLSFTEHLQEKLGTTITIMAAVFICILLGLFSGPIIQLIEHTIG